ncbi:MAG: hypothetical protein WA705_31685 [Candidatus Ozemobacteraceae bacterium]
MQELMGLSNVGEIEKALPASFVLHGNEEQKGFVTALSMKRYLGDLLNRVRLAVTGDDQPEFIVRAASTGSLRFSLEPIAWVSDA